MELKELTLEHSDTILPLAIELNPKISLKELRSRLQDMFGYDNYHCFGFIINSEIIGMSSGWLTSRFYSGKQLEIDNVIVKNQYQSKGYGQQFLKLLESWAVQNGCLTIELNTYVSNSKSHKFYFNQGYSILGYHFQKNIHT